MPAETVSISVLGPDYDNIRPMAAGGTGELFRAHKRGLDVEVVVKRVKAQFQGRMNETREANILKNLRHQYLPRIYDVIYAPDGFIYTVMEFIAGCDMAEYVKNMGALDQKQALKWLRQLCEVTAYLHRQRPAVIHCDLKPQNIMIAPDGDICVIDFNTSLLRDKSELDPLGATCGYAAPEQYNLNPQAVASFPPAEREKWTRWSAAAAACGKITELTDIYAIGAVAYFMLTGYAPGHSVDGYVPLSQYRIKLGESLRAVIERAMQPLPKDRFSSAAAMLKALENLKKTDRRHRAWQARCQIAAVCLSALVLVSSFCVWLGVRMRGEESGEAYAAILEEADGLISRQKYDEAMELVGQAISMDNDRIDAYVRAATVLYRTGQYEEGVDLLSGLNLASEDSELSQEEFAFAQAELSYLLGSCSYQLADYEAAVESFEMAVWFAPEEGAYYRDLAVSQARLGDIDAAYDTCAAMEDLDGVDEEDILFVETELQFREGDYEGALEGLTALLSLTRDDETAARSWLMAAQCCRNLGSGYLERELALLEEGCASLDLSYTSALTEQLVDCLMRMGSQTGDPTCYERAYTQASNLMGRGVATLAVRLNAALALQYLGDYDGALALASETADVFPNDYRAYVRLALLYLTEPLYNAEAAREAYERAAALHSGAGAQNSEFLYLESLIQNLP